MAVALVTGGNRGIGLELCRRLAARGDRVLAACRSTTPELSELGVQILEGVDVGDGQSVRTMAERLGDVPVDLLINNAGILTRQTLDDLDPDGIRRQFEINSLGPLRVTSALLPRMQRGAKVVIVTSLMGSMADNSSGGSYGYRMSKAAANMAGVSLSHDLRDRGIAVMLLHPGMVATEMTGGRGISVEESVEGMLARIDELTLEDSGGFRHANGGRLPW